eukprot:1160924-Pelagomonas_calceolata.AAC.3
MLPPCSVSLLSLHDAKVSWWKPVDPIPTHEHTVFLLYFPSLPHARGCTLILTFDEDSPKSMQRTNLRASCFASPAINASVHLSLLCATGHLPSSKATLPPSYGAGIDGRDALPAMQDSWTVGVRCRSWGHTGSVKVNSHADNVKVTLSHTGNVKK